MIHGTFYLILMYTFCLWLFPQYAEERGRNCVSSLKSGKKRPVLTPKCIKVMEHYYLSF